jgi:hypothetical protein
MKDFIFACLLGAFFGVMFAIGFMDISALDLFNFAKSN